MNVLPLLYETVPAIFDPDPPDWVDDVGIQSCVTGTGIDAGSLIITWAEAQDLSQVFYNIYIKEVVNPVDIFDSTNRLVTVTGVLTYKIAGLPNGSLLAPLTAYRVAVRAVDAFDNEEENGNTILCNLSSPPAVSAPSLLTVVDNVNGTSVDITYIPPIDVNYDFTQIRFKLREETVFTFGVTDVGIPGESSIVNQPGLTNHRLYDFQIHAVDIFGNVSLASKLDSRWTDDDTFISEEEAVLVNFTNLLATNPAFQEWIGATGDANDRFNQAQDRIYKVSQKEEDIIRPFAFAGLDDTFGSEKVALGIFVEQTNLLVGFEDNTTGDSDTAFLEFSQMVGRIRKDLQALADSDQFPNIRSIKPLIAPKRASREESADVYTVVYVIELGI